MKYLTDNTRITGLMEVSPPVEVIDKLPITEKVSELVFNSEKIFLTSFMGKKTDWLLLSVHAQFMTQKQQLNTLKNLKILKKS